MFKHFKEDTARGLCEETNCLLKMPREQRYPFVINKFNFLSSQAQYPVRYDNEKKWIKYYDRASINRKKFRFNTRFSLNTTDVPRLPHSMNFMSTSCSMIGSSIKLSDSRTVTQSTIYH
jgi:hypothetical protein